MSEPKVYWAKQFTLAGIDCGVQIVPDYKAWMSEKDTNWQYFQLIEYSAYEKLVEENKKLKMENANFKEFLKEYS